MIFVATKNGRTKKKCSPFLLVLLLDPGSGMNKIRIRDPGSNIPDPQHCIF
jgi:hypothetical protein